MKWLCKIYLRLIGWRTGSKLPASVRKCVLVGAPHTSNMDYPIALATLCAGGGEIQSLRNTRMIRVLECVGGDFETQVHKDIDVLGQGLIGNDFRSKAVRWGFDKRIELFGCRDQVQNP